MDLSLILQISQMALGLASNLTGGKTQETLQIIAQLEAIAGKVAETHMALVGTPIDPDALKYEEPIP